MAIMKRILLLLCIVTLVSSFNSDRLLDEEHKVSVETADENIRNERAAYNTHEHIDHRSGNKKVRGGKRRHIRNRRDELPEDVREIFDLPDSLLQQQVHPIRRSVSNDFYSQFQNYIQRATALSNPQGYSQSPGAYHNTIVPNGPQVNNYYPQYPSTPYSAGWNPYGNQPGQVIYAPVIFVPFPFCFPQQPSQTPMNISGDVNNRFGGDSQGDTGISYDGMTNSQRPVSPNVNANDYFRPIVGISLEPAVPLRPPTRPSPPIMHSSGSNSNQNQNQNQNQNSAPYPPQSQFAPQSSNSGGAFSNSQAVRPTQRPRPNNARPITTLRPTFVENNIENTYNEPSSCVTAIVRCCVGPNEAREARDRCFERNSCGGAFFDQDPCDSALARAAQQTIFDFSSGVNYGK